MTTSFTTNKLFGEAAYGDTNWNVPLNINTSLLDQALGSSYAIYTGTGGTTTLSTPTQITSAIPIPPTTIYWWVAQQWTISSGTAGTPVNLTSNAIVAIPSGTPGAWIVSNSISAANQSSYTVTVQVVGNATNIVTIANGQTAYIFSNGTGVYAADTNIIAAPNPTFYGTALFAGTTTVNAGSFTVGNTYTIASIGTTNFTLIGATANTVGLAFVATGVGSGTGTAILANAAVNVAGSISPTGVITPRIQTASSTSTAPNSNIADIYELSVGASTIASFPAPTGSPVNGQKLILRLIPSGAVTITAWVTTSGGYRVIGTTLPTSLISGKTTYVGCIYNSTAGYWDVVAVGTQS